MDEKALENLKELFLFQLLSKDEIKEIVDIFYEKVYAAGTKIFSENDKGDTMYIIKSGSVKITKQKDGEEQEIITLMPGDFFGEVALFDYVFRTATATAVEETAVLEVQREQFNKLFSQKPHTVAKILYQMMCEMSRRLRRTIPPRGLLIF